VPALPAPLDVSFEAAYSHAENALDVEVILHVNGEPHLAFHINVTILLKYEIASGFEPTEEQVLAFSDLTAIGDAWPYAREFIQDVTSRMGLPTSPLPTLRIVARDGGKRRLSSERKSA
jgi:preprotein translocase subunit SecB